MASGNLPGGARCAHDTNREMKVFRNRVAVVTGAASGIGLALVDAFVAEGMQVVMADIDEEALDVNRAGSAQPL